MEQDLTKIKNLIATATNARQKAMYEGLLLSAQKQLRLSQEKASPRTTPAQSIGKSNKEKKSQKVSESKNSDVVKSSSAKTSKSTNKNKQAESDESKAIFQAIGVIEGIVSVGESDRLRITLGEKKYRLGYTYRARNRDYRNLLEEIKSRGSVSQKLAVYPQINYHYRTKESEISFNLVSVPKKAKNLGIFVELVAGEFYLSGYWQYVPFCNQPCITVVRNYSEELAEYVQKIEKKKARKLLKPNHLPVGWSESTIEAFKYDPNLTKQQQMPRWFVQLKTNFVPELNEFTVVELTGEATKQAPRYLKK